MDPEWWCVLALMLDQRRDEMPQFKTEKLFLVVLIKFLILN